MERPKAVEQIGLGNVKVVEGLSPSNIHEQSARGSIGLAHIKKQSISGTIGLGNIKEAPGLTPERK